MQSVNFFKPQGVKNNKETELSVFYTNDMHGDVNRLAKLKTAHDEFTKSNKNTANLTLGGGDLLYGKDEKRLSLIKKVLNMMKLDATALGNHEFTKGSDGLAKQLEDLDCKAVGTNLEIPEGNKLQDRIKDKKLVKSAVFMRGGQKFAVIGASPCNAEIGAKDDEKTTVNAKNVNDTIKAINSETKELEKQGINKIILCSHMGYGEDAELKIARETEGVDIIIGGHTHDIIEGVNKSNNGGTKLLNLVKSKRNEPVILTQAGKLNQKAGFLNVVFDENGILKEDKIVNKLANVADFKADKAIEKLSTDTLGKNETLAKIKTGYTPMNEFHERYMENPVVNIFADSILEKGQKQGVQAVLFPTTTLKGGMECEITTYDVKYGMLPFNGTYKMIDITEKDFVELLNTSSEKLFTDFDPPLMRCSGLKYTVNQTPDLKANEHIQSAELTNIKGNTTQEINVKNPSNSKTIKIAIDDYMFCSPNSKEILAKYKESAKDLGTSHEIFIDYLKNQKEIDCSIPKENRITINYDNLETFCSQYPMEDKKAALNLN